MNSVVLTKDCLITKCKAAVKYKVTCLKVDFKFFSSRVKHSSESAASASFLRSCTVIGRFACTEILACLFFP